MPMNVGITMPMRRKTKRNMVRPYGLGEEKTQPATRACDPGRRTISTSFSNRAKSVLREFYGWLAGLLDAHAVEARVAERFDTHVDHLLADRLVNGRVGDRRER